MLRVLSARGLAAAGAGLVIVMLVLASCASSPRPRYRMRLADTGPPALHAVHSERLQSIMADLHPLTMERLPQEYHAQAERYRRLDEAAEVAAAVAQTAKHIPEALPEGGFSEQERSLFVKLTKKMEAEALNLKLRAGQRSVPRMAEAMDRLAATCNACHTAFRLPSVDSSAR